MPTYENVYWAESYNGEFITNSSHAHTHSHTHSSFSHLSMDTRSLCVTSEY